ncbi:hypothetical protein MRB53_013755 [Persea americana]|uniref:Uncharacterized protein n=1 Tax=Persea americana TaxID=3435 RepID=A0ACC2K8Y3_PERAE|nr:hypothetical protein MRB53_013755 [Persea americana]
MGKLPDYGSLRVFWCKCFPYLRDYATSKFDPRSLPCTFLGYSHTYKGYRCFHPPTGRIYSSRHVVFDETSFPFKDPSSLYSVSHDSGEITSFSEWVSGATNQTISPSPLLLPCLPEATDSLACVDNCPPHVCEDRSTSSPEFFNPALDPTTAIQTEPTTVEQQLSAPCPTSADASGTSLLHALLPSSTEKPAPTSTYDDSSSVPPASVVVTEPTHGLPEPPHGSPSATPPVQAVLTEHYHGSPSSNLQATASCAYACAHFRFLGNQATTQVGFNAIDVNRSSITSDHMRSSGQGMAIDNGLVVASADVQGPEE